MTTGLRHRGAILTLSTAILAGMALDLGSGARPSAAAPLCAGTSPIADRFPADPGCCGADFGPDSTFTCTSAAEGLVRRDPMGNVIGTRKNALVIVIDDQSYCYNGYMAGRCAVTPNDSRCTGRRCADAEWVACQADAECPDPDGPQTPLCLPSSTGLVCNSNPAMACSNPDLCPATPNGEAKTCVEGCMHGFERQCAFDAQCDEDANEICVDGLCSPRADCSGAKGAHVCARTLGTCNVSQKYCSNSPATPCDDVGQCPPVGCGEARRCVAFCSNTSPAKAQTCTQDGDCHDTCDGGLCRRTPASCGPNSDCAAFGVYGCTSGDHPLRLNEISCRYRRPAVSTGDDKWSHSLVVEPTQKQLVHTPTLDGLAAAGAVFPRARSGGQSCQPGRASLLTGRVMRHLNDTFATHMQCRMSENPPHQTFDEAKGCTTGENCGDYDSVCDRRHSIPFLLDARAPADDPDIYPVAETYTIGIGKIEAADIVPEFDASISYGGAGGDAGKFTCTTGSTCETALKGGKLPKEAIAAQAELVSRIRSTIGITGLDANEPPPPGNNPHLPFFAYYGPEIPHDGANLEQYFTSLYGGSLTESQNQAARTSFLDASLGALRDELTRTCVCAPEPGNPGGPGFRSSLWEQTVVFVVTDHGQSLVGHQPGASAKNGEPTENAHRFSMIVRVPGEVPRVLSEGSQFAGYYDLLPTIMDYVNGFTGGSGSGQSGEGDQLDRYPLNQSLRDFLANNPTSTPFLRDLFYGAHSDNFNEVGDGKRRYVVTRAGFLGVCDAPGTSRACRPELGDDDCNVPGVGGSCRTYGGLCVNTRRWCASDDACAQCAGTCQPPVGGGPEFHDFATRTCGQASDCVPVGACRPPVVKLVRNGGSLPFDTFVFELNSNPDEFGSTSGTDDEPFEEDLFNDTLTDDGFLPLALQSDLVSCVDEFWELSSPQGGGAAPDLGPWRPGDEGCPYRQWPICDGAGDCPPFP